ncbi:prephenate dehydratase [Alkalihalobacterium chitinilyticum]|uniref:Prephenate dehydratase n=1 Tax=Alkalihalobacterium chitinilyticum TaxID=2980103 RepID=A0ABT5VI64_9BACI|nr:prephenate dehydratase [Alkalihalobacterium chitinilyticum]MDE5415007.1 prephenate dehydratase [Alkalihalobacterium chitinilyticum]
MKTIGFLGPVGTFTEMAAMSIFPKQKRKEFSTIPACMEGVSTGEVDAAVVPLENAIEGSVNLTLDYIIHKHQLPIVGEVVVPVEQHLLIHPKHMNDWKAVSTIYSHPHAIAQCHEFLRTALPQGEVEYTNSTSAAAKFIMENSDLKAAAIGNELAAKTYNLSIIAKNIHDYDNNRTRFVILSKKKDEIITPYTVGHKTTLMVTLPSDYSGALHQVLSAFSWRKLNLSKIESRPMKTGLGNYFFVIDVEQKMDEILIPGVMAELEALGCGVRVLGSYPCFTIASVNDVSKKPIPE